MTRGNRRQLRPFPVAGEPGERATVEHVNRLLGTTPAEAPTVRRRQTKFSLTEVSPGIRSLSFVFGIFLSYAVLRIQELYPVLAVPKLPFIMAVVVALGAVLSVPVAGWQQLWNVLPPIRWQLLLIALGLLTAPIGIWMSGSIHYYFFVYSVSVIVFLATVVFLRDRRAMASTLWVMLATSAVVASYTLSDSAKTIGRTDRVKLGVSLDPNDLAMLFVAMTPLAIYMAQRKGAGASDGRSSPR